MRRIELLVLAFAFLVAIRPARAEMTVIPQNGQTPEQTSKDKVACEKSAAQGGLSPGAETGAGAAVGSATGHTARGAAIARLHARRKETKSEESEKSCLEKKGYKVEG